MLLGTLYTMANPKVVLSKLSFEDIARVCNGVSASIPLKLGSCVYVYTVLKSRENSYNWLPGTIKAIIKRTLQQTPGQNKAGEDVMYEVQTMDKDTNFLLYVTVKYLAYPNAPDYELKETTRVIARNSDLLFKLGTIGEKPTTNNKRRYLVFFDDGSAQYCHHSNLRVVCKGELTSDVLTPETQFLTNYFAKYPVRPVVKLAENDSIEIQLNGKWQKSTVHTVDSSMVLLDYENENGIKKEWVYRGSPRLAPIHFLTSGERVVHKNKSDKSLLRSRGFGTALVYKGKPIPIEYTSVENGFQDSHQLTTHLKSQSVSINDYTQRKPIINQDLECTKTAEDSSKSSSMHENSNSKDHLKTAVQGTKMNLMEQKILTCKRSIISENKTVKKMRPETKLIERKLQDKLTPMQFIQHQCGPDCVSWTGCNVDTDYKYDPLVKPLVFGFQRYKYTYHFTTRNSINKKKTVVMYKTPCGRSLRSFKSIVEYLRVTQSTLTCDMFNLDPKINPLMEFTEGYTYFQMKDLSQGQEYVPISVVNELDETQPDEFIYTTQMISNKDVPLNRDPEFLSSCDCTDDCQDASKCSCHRLTSEGEFKKLTYDVGYKFRRLLNKVETGIYECNSRCKCSSQCGNRVVQKPLNLRLQLFKTEKKGWGLRCLHDLPKGTFLCCYVGEILCEEQIKKKSNCKYGDRYVAELDFIELSESHKKGYEKNVYEIDVRGVLSEKKPYNKEPNEGPNKKHGVYLVDARFRGNIGRFFNHACTPNVFVQNVFVETHDLRFPCLAFFTSCNVSAGTELAWDYCYDVGATDYQILCYCETANCRRRLL